MKASNILILGACLFLAGCASSSKFMRNMDADFSVFHNLPSDLDGSTFVAWAGDTNLWGSLEAESYVQTVRDQLTSHGLVDVGDMPADWLVVVEFWDYPPTKVDGAKPVYGQVSSGSTTRHSGIIQGSGGSASYSGSSHTGPQYGVVGMRPTVDYWFGWGVRVQFYGGAEYRANLAAQRYDGKSHAISKGGSRMEAFPAMIRELLRDFPGPEQQNRTAVVPLKPRPPDNAGGKTP